MFGSGVQFGTRRLWQITTSGTVTNDRATGITTPNPITINEYYTNAYFAIRVTAKAGGTITRINIYGASSTLGFPPAGTNAEVLCSTVTDIALNAGIVRVPAMHTDDADTRQRLLVLPRVLLLEYTTVFAVGAIVIVVDLCAVGPWVMARE
jgi:hypothetical protein